MTRYGLPGPINDNQSARDRWSPPCQISIVHANVLDVDFSSAKAIFVYLVSRAPYVVHAMTGQDASLCRFPREWPRLQLGSSNACARESRS
jgi:hypothetical protein